MNRIFRQKQTENFTILPNAIFKSGLSLKAVGLLSYILHLPNDWIIVKTQIYKAMEQDGRQSVDSAWRELAESGFIKTEKQVGENGNLPIISYYVYDSPQKDVDSQHAGFQHADSTHAGFTQPKTRQLLSTNQQSTIEQSTKQLSTKEENTVIVPVGTNAPTESTEGEKKKREQVVIPDNTEEIKKEHARYFAEIVPELNKIDQVAAKRKLADYILEKKPAFYEPYKDLWNMSAAANGLAKVSKLSESRLRHFRSRLKDPDFDFIAVMMAIKKYPFLRGENKNNWRVNWEFVFKNDTNYLKILEGAYQ
jgi:hypothetical protein